MERVWNLCDKSMHLQFYKDKEHLYFFVGRKRVPLLLEELSSIARGKIEKFPTLLGVFAE